jgi:type IV pilus assembly protein PilW
LLVRSVEPVVGYVNDKTYDLGGEIVGPFNDAFYRRVYSTTVQIRNSPKLKFRIME